MPSNKVKLEICGSSYVISTNDAPEYLIGLAERLDQDMNQIMVDTPNASVTAAAVITALGYLDEAEKSAFGADNMRAQLQDYLEDAAKARMAAEEAKREVEKLRKELSFYEGKEKKQPSKQGAPLSKNEKSESKSTEKESENKENEIDVLPGQIEISEL